MTEPGADVTAERLQLAERRWQRERAARLESERIAESGLHRLWLATSELDARVEQRTRQLRVEQQRAQRAAAAKTVFLANLSHEVRTPLQTILASLELTRPRDGADAARRSGAIDAARQMVSLFDNLLELAQLESGSLELEARPTHLEAVADRLVERWSEPLRERGLLLVPESDGDALVDAARLVQIGEALLDNCHKFASPGTVLLRMSSVAGRTVLEVEDEGPGVPAADLTRMFEPFVQLDGGNDRTVGGAGIGLALVRGLADRMGGTARAASPARRGVTVTVDIPDELDDHDRTIAANGAEVRA